jgi:BirA family biotin operon repressor/biotin-[acetyl-CoA-carboxylase] ligase
LTSPKPLPGVSQLLRLTETDSTQTVARFLAEQGAPHGTLVWADRQTGGRGRMSRRWDSRPGGLYFSLLLRPSFAHSRLPALSLETAQSVGYVLQTLSGRRHAVKPPNDVMAVVKGEPRKIAGILIESSGTSRRLDWLVIGIGVNVNNAARGSFKAASLKSLTGRAWDEEAVLRAILGRFVGINIV